jgi:hypothetical protein
VKWAELRNLDSAEKRWPHTFAAVEGDSFQAWEWVQKFRPGTTWEQGHGWLVTLGEVWIGPKRLGRMSRMPVCVSVMWEIIGGKLIAFYESTSTVVDHRMVDKYIRENCERTGDVTNFHNVMGEIERATPTKSVAGGGK